jgi:hypothetical protein
MLTFSLSFKQKIRAVVVVVLALFSSSASACFALAGAISVSPKFSAEQSLVGIVVGKGA